MLKYSEGKALRTSLRIKSCSNTGELIVIRVDIEKIKMEWLSVESLVTLSRYVEVAHEYDGAVLPLQSDNLLKLVVLHVRKTDSSMLKNMYADLKVQIKKGLMDPKIKAMLSNGEEQSYDIEIMSTVIYSDFAA